MTLSNLMIFIYNKENQWCSNLEQYYTESSFLRMLVWVDNPNSWFRQQRGRMEFSGISSPINGGDSKGSPRTGKGIYIEQEPANNKQWMGFPDPCFQVKREFAHATHHISWLHVIRFRITDARRRRRLVLFSGMRPRLTLTSHIITTHGDEFSFYDAHVLLFSITMLLCRCEFPRNAPACSFGGSLFIKVLSSFGWKFTIYFSI